MQPIGGMYRALKTALHVHTYLCRAVLRALYTPPITPPPFGVIFFQFQISIDDLVLYRPSLLPRSVEKRPRRLRLEMEIKRHSKCNRLYMYERTGFYMYERTGFYRVLQGGQDA